MTVKLLRISRWWTRPMACLSVKGRETLLVKLISSSQGVIQGESQISIFQCLPGTKHL